MGDQTTIDAARVAEIVALAIPALTEALAALDKPSLELVLDAEKAKGNDARTGAVAAITAAIEAIDNAEAEAKAKEEADAKTAADAVAAKEAEEAAAREKAEAEEKAAAEAKAAADATPVEPVVYDGHTEMRNADGAGCSWRGISYDADAHGVVTVPVAAAADLIDHGFNFVPAKG
jgi:hypothetical protein